MHIAIIEDFKTDQRKILDCIHRFFQNSCLSQGLLTHSFDSAEAFLDGFTPDFYDLIFIDYYLNKITGLQMAQKIRNLDSIVQMIFVTSSRDFAIDGYKVHALGYLVKPFSYKDFSETLSGLKLAQIQERQFIEITDGYEKIKILIGDILYCNMLAHYAYIHTRSIGTRRSRTTFASLQKMLEPYPRFLLCYRGCLINMDHIQNVTESEFCLCNGESVPFQKKNHQRILDAYSQYIFHKARCKQ